MTKSTKMNWKLKKHRLASEDDEDTEQSMMTGFPMFINAQESTLPSCGIRVVENKLFFYGEIDEQSCLELNRVLIELDLKLQNLRNILGDDYKPVIHLHINTPGGEIYAAFSTVDTILNLKSDVYTYADGLVASAGTLISAVGDKRYCGKHAHMLIHQLSSAIYGTFADLQAGMDSATMLMKLLKEFYKKNTKVPMKRLDELMTKDIYLTADECLNYGIVDEIK
jgi:ATP-dependent Clp endopeptidase proteolytic subunit ClpP